MMCKMMTMMMDVQCNEVTERLFLWSGSRNHSVGYVDGVLGAGVNRAFDVLVIKLICNGGGGES